MPDNARREGPAILTEPPAPPPVTAFDMTEIFLIRHGQASFGENNYDRLSETGIAQSRRLGEWLAAEGIGFDAVYSGERERQRDTALHALSVAEDAPALRVERAFNELDADRLLQHAIPHVILREPSLAGMLLDLKANRDMFRRVFERIVDEWVGGAWESAGIGRWDDFSGRVREGVVSLAQRHREDRRIAVFTSGGPITAMLQALGGERRHGLDWRIANTSITRIGVDGQGRLVLLGERELPHLAARDDLLTHL